MGRMYPAPNSRQNEGEHIHDRSQNDILNIPINDLPLESLKIFARICDAAGIDINKEIKKEGDERDGGKR